MVEKKSCLLDYYCDLCDHVVMHFRVHMSVPIGRYDQGYRKWMRKNLKSSNVKWFKEYIESQINATEDQIRLPLNAHELEILRELTEDPPPRLEKFCMWEPYDALYDRYTTTLQEIRTRLSTATADEWGTLSVKYKKKLIANGLPLATGIKSFSDYAFEILRLLNDMAVVEFIPRPAGSHPTPSNPIKLEKSHDEPQATSMRLESLIEEIKKLLRENPNLRNSKTEAIITKISRRKQDVLNALRILKVQGFYGGE